MLAGVTDPPTTTQKVRFCVGVPSVFLTLVSIDCEAAVIVVPCDTTGVRMIGKPGSIEDKSASARENADLSVQVEESAAEDLLKPYIVRAVVEPPLEAT